MATYCTPDNGKDQYLLRTLNSLHETVDFTKHRMILIDNSPEDLGLKAYQRSFLAGKIDYISNNGNNVGTAEAVNQGWIKREPKEHAIKMDDDVVIHQRNWIEMLEECIERDNQIGII